MGLKKQIIQFKDGEQVAIYESATEAAKAVGSINATISKCCLGKIKQVNGYTFKYTGEYTNKVEHNGEYKCPYCDERFETYNGLCKHVLMYKVHGDDITREQLLTDFKYGGVRPICKCGCGGYTKIRYEGEPHFQDYIVGHHNRVHNNWGHNENAKLRSAETRRRQYSSGERVQWNKGKKWSETFSEEKIKKEIEGSFSEGLSDFNPVIFRYNFISLMSSLNISLKEIADGVGYDVSYISRLRTGKRSPADPVAFIDSVSRFVAENYNDPESKKSLAVILNCWEDELDSKEKIESKVYHWLLEDANSRRTFVEEMIERMDAFNDAEYHRKRIGDIVKNIEKNSSEEDFTYEVKNGIQHLKECEYRFISRSPAAAAESV